MSVAGEVIVVGGGLAGIAAALDCVDAGAAVTLVEVRPRLGGAAYSVQRDGLWLDNGQHVFLRCCTAYRTLLERLGTTPQTHLQPRLAVPVLEPGRPAAWLRRSARSLPAPAHLAPSLLRYRPLTITQRLSAARAAQALTRVDPDNPQTDTTSFGEWLTEHGQGARATDALWELIARPTINLRAADASLATAAFVFRVGLLQRADAGDIGYARAPLQRIHGDAALTALQRAGVRVELSWRARAISPEPAARLSVTGAAETLEADAVILAVPHDRAVPLLPAGAHPDPERLHALGRSPIVNLHVGYDRPVLPFEFAAAIGSPVQFVFDRTETSGAQEGQTLAVSLSAADHEAGLDREALRARFLPALAQLLPAAAHARVTHFSVTKEHAATFRAAPGSAGLRPGAKTGVEGLLLAGAWTDTGWPATMEGAVRSGHTAAAAALAHLGRPRAAREVVA